MADSVNTRDVLTARALRVRLDPVHPDPEILLSAAEIIRHGGVIAYPTETVYGLGADPFNQEAVGKLLAAKGRSSDSPFILIVSHPGQVFDLASPAGPATTWLDKLARAFWPGPLTLVLPAKPRLDCPALAGGATVAVRISSHPVAWQLARTSGRPITSTSANLSASEPARSAEGISPALASSLDLILDSGQTPGQEPSTILDLSSARPVVLREGSVKTADLARVLGFAPRPLRLPKQSRVDS